MVLSHHTAGAPETRLFSALLGLAPSLTLGEEHLRKLNVCIGSGALGVQAPFVSVEQVRAHLASLTERLAMAKNYNLLPPEAQPVRALPAARKLSLVR
jgi:hypothetical protein